jgi:20S proteasome alpha/beta subunit
MNELVLAFLERWVEENVNGVAAGLEHEEAERLAAACIADAAEQDISEEDLAETCAEASDGDDLVTYMTKAIENAATADLDDVNKDEGS